jgi:hypothetical protein
LAGAYNRTDEIGDVSVGGPYADDIAVAIDKEDVPGHACFAEGVRGKTLQDHRICKIFGFVPGENTCDLGRQ